MKKLIATPNAPAAVGPYSQALSAKGEITFVSGQLPIDTTTGEFPAQDIAEQTRCSLENVQAVLKAAGCSMDDVLKTTVFLSDIKNFEAMNKVYSEYFQEPYPARAAFQVAALPKGALVEIEAVACR
ncbi:putative reactive intermediate deaminase TdcF [bioreactor metagenome]|uniref:Putative reactive intermediate deaminase TdcF n=1 Tax=bioreactor metagenome TaxID=1076179 RepID=A0A644VW08_9ZZZZ